MTDLGFLRFDELSRAGWFHPSEDGEKLMPAITAVHRTFDTYAHRDRNVLDELEPLRSTAFADVAEALHHVDALDLTLHRQDGSLVPTELIGIQDMEELRALVWEEDERSDAQDHESLGWLQEDEGEFELNEAEAELLEQFDRDQCDSWMPEEESPLPRYQIIVRLLEGNAIA